MSSKVLNENGKNEAISVVIVDDHPIVRAGVSQLINEQPDLHVTGEAEDAQQAIERIKDLQPDVAIVDINLKGINGLDLIRTLKSMVPNMPVLVLSMHDEMIWAERVLRAGARGYIMKQEATEQVLEAIRKVHRKELWVSDRIKDKLLDVLVGGREAPASPVDVLSDRELDIFLRIGRGKGTREIAKDLHLSAKTVESHRTNIKRKLKLRTAAELQRAAFQWVQQTEQG